MAGAHKKLNRVQPLIKAKKADLDRETAALAEIRRTKHEAIARLKENQRRYMEGVGALNKERQSGSADRMFPLESGLDYVKEQWYESLRVVRHLEEKELKQLEALMEAKRNLKSMEALGDRYHVMVGEERKRQEQKALDEIGMMLHNSKRA